jgi:hypothetical protein
MTTLNYFQNFEIILNKDVEVSDEFNPIDSNLFENSGISENSEHGSYSLCTIKKNSKAFASMQPNGDFYLTDSINSHTSHATLNRDDFSIVDKSLKLPKILTPTRNGLFQ